MFNANSRTQTRPNTATRLPDSAHRGLSPCPAVTAVMRNPVYTVRSHRVHTSNCPSVASQICHQHTHTRFSYSHTFSHELIFQLFFNLNNIVFAVGSPQHQGRLSLDLSQQKRTSDYSESTSSRSSRASHGTSSLPSSARLGQSDSHTCMQHTGLSVPLPRQSVSTLTSVCFQVLLAMFSTAQRGSRSPPRHAIPAPCWAQTEVRRLLASSVIKYSKAPGLFNKKELNVRPFLQEFPQSHTWVVLLTPCLGAVMYDLQPRCGISDLG